MYIISALGLRGLFSSRTPIEHHAHPTLETTGLADTFDVIRTPMCSTTGAASPWNSIRPTHVNAGRPRTEWMPANEDDIFTYVRREPWRRSSRDMVRELGLSQLRVLEVLSEDQLHPYQHSRSARLLSDDRPLRTQFCEWLRHQHTAD
jgi:hypothetical protein